MAWGSVRIWQVRPALAQAQLGSYAILRQYPDFALTKWREAGIDVNKDLAFLRSRGKLTGDELKVEVTVPPSPLITIKAPPLIHRWEKCGSCGKLLLADIPKSMMDRSGQCLICRTSLCNACNKSGLCPEHYSALTPQHQHDLQVFDKERGQLQKRIDWLIGGIYVAIILSISVMAMIVSIFLLRVPGVWGWAILAYMVVMVPFLGFFGVKYRRLLAAGVRTMAVADTILQQYPALWQLQVRSFHFSIAKPESPPEAVIEQVSRPDALESESNQEIPLTPKKNTQAERLDDPPSIKEWKNLVGSDFPCL